MKHRWAYNLLVLSVVTYFVVSALLSLWKARLEPPPVIDPATSRTAKARSSTVQALNHYDIIAERNLFHTSKESAPPPPQEDVSLEGIPLALNSLGLKLVGTAVTEKPEDNIAFIETRRARKQEAYREGDEVEKVVVKKILRQNVIINTGKRDEVLTMEPEENAGEAPAPKQVSRPQPFTSKQEPVPNAIRLDRKEIEASVSDLNKLMQEVKVRPYLEGGEPAGFLVSDIKPGSIFTKMGIRNGDIIKGVNEETITSPDQAIQLYQSLVEGGEIALQIKRGQRSRELRYEIQ